MAHSDNASPGPAPAPFAVVMRGFDREQVNQQFHRYQAELRVLAADRDAASAHARELTDLLDEAQDEIDHLRREIDRLSVPPTTAEGMSDRIARMMRLASDEASEIRASAANEAAEVRSLADQDAETTRRDAESVRTDMANRRVAMDDEHERTMEAARQEAERIVADAEARAATLERTAQENRERVQNDFDLAMSMRRDKAIRTITDLEDTSKLEARERIDAANERSEHTLNTTNATAQQKLQETNTTVAAQVAEARRITSKMQDLRSSIFEQLEGARSQLTELADALAAGRDEQDVLDDLVPTATYASVAVSRAAHLDDPEPSAVERATTVFAEHAADDSQKADSQKAEPQKARANAD